MSKIITRQEIRELLQRWQVGDLSHKFVYDWANERYSSRRWDTEDEIVDQVLTELYSLDMNLTTAEDVPHLLNLLTIPQGQIGTAMALIREYTRSIDLKSRRLTLAKDPLYGPHCKLTK
jgi:hypothetical protein